MIFYNLLTIVLELDLMKEELGVDLTGYASVTIGRVNRYFKA